MNGTFLAGLIAPLLAAPACLALIIYAFPRCLPPGIHVTPWIAAAGLAWATSDLLVASAQPALAFPWNLALWLKSLGMDLLPLASLAQILQVTGQSRKLGRNAGVLISVLLVSEQGLFWFENRLNQPQEIYSAWNALHLLLRAGPLLAAGFLLAYHFLQAPRLYQRISWTYLAGSLFIGIAYILEFSGVSLAGSSHLSPVLAVISQAGFLIAANRFHLHANLPLTRNALMDKLSDAVFILDAAGCFVDLNAAARSILNALPQGSGQKSLINQPIGGVFPQLARLFENPHQTIPNRLEFDVSVDNESRFLELSISPLSGPSSLPVGWLVFLRDISRQKIEQSLQQERLQLWENQARLLDATLSASPDFFMLHDRQGRFLYASPAFVRLIGQPLDKLVHTTWRELDLPAPVCELFVTYLEKAFQTQEPHSFEFTLTENDHQRFFEAYLNPFNPGQPDESRMVTAVREVTNRRKMEEALKASEQRYRSIVEVLDEGIVIQDRSGRVTGCNRSAERLLGLSVDASLGKIFVDTQQLAIREDGSPFPHESHPAMRALQSGQPQEKIIMGVTAPGQDLRWLLVNSQPLFENGGDEPYAVVSSYVDITPNKLAENALRNSQRRFETLLEFAPAAILVVDEQARIQLVNGRAEQELGYSRQQLLGQSILNLIPERFRQSHVRHHQKFIQNPSSRQMGANLSLFALNSDGLEFPVDIGLSPIETNEGLRVICYLVNVTERKRQEDALQRVNEQLTRSLADLQHHNRELILLSEMSEMLQRCETIEEAYKVSTEFAQRLFPGLSGALYLYNLDRWLIESTITWGEFPPLHTAFPPGDCWALRRGRSHAVERFENGLRCQHIEPQELQPEAGFICVPMQTQGQAMGMFHLRGQSENLIRSLENLAATFTGHITISFSNISLRDTLRTQSVHDPLTGLHNRRYLEEALNREIAIARRYPRDLSIILFDIDHFKNYNDAYGHAFGDSLLEAVGEHLRRNLRSVDIACRYGGEEFLILLPDTSLESSLNVATKLKHGLSQLRFEKMEASLDPIQVSMGVSAFQGEPQTGSELIQNADQALYQAKQAGRNRIISA